MQALIAILTAAGPALRSARGEDPPAGSEEEIADLKRRVAELEKKQLPPGPQGSRESDHPSDRKGEETGKPNALRGVYDKPFLTEAWRRAHLGGYTDFDFHSFADDPLGIPRGFRAHRTNLFAFADISDRVQFAAEIEFENEEPREDLEVKVEMAFIDWMLFEELVIRGGALLVPLGRINVNHDGPVRDLTDRPMVSTFVIPTTLTEAGIGPHGTIALLDELSLSYEAYAVNGFDLLPNGALAVPITEREQLLREGRPSLGGDVNASIASTGRVSIQALGVIDLGYSWYVGDYDEGNNNTLAIHAGDVSASYGPFALEGELAWAGFERDTAARALGIPDNFWGYYVQASGSWMPPFLRDTVPYIFDDPGAIFTAVLRWERIDLDGDEAEALEPGLDFRPVPDTVFKFSYRFGFKGVGERGVPGRHLTDDGFIFSMATYF